MVRRRSPIGTHDPAKASAAIQEGLAHLAGRFEQMAGDLNARLGRIEKDAAEGRIGQERLRAEMAEGRRDAGELRDGLSALRAQVEKSQADQAGLVAESAAHGAAQGALESTAPALAEARRGRPASRTERWGAAALIGLVALAIFRDAPVVVRGIDAVWTMLKGLNQ